MQDLSIRPDVQSQFQAGGVGGPPQGGGYGPPPGQHPGPGPGQMGPPPGQGKVTTGTYS